MEANNTPEVRYRVVEVIYSNGVDVDGEPIPGPGKLAIRLEEYEVIRKTPKGVWIAHWRGEKFINDSWNKRYALPTKKDAVESYIARKQRQLRIAKATVQRAFDGMDLARNWQFTEVEEFCDNP